MSLIIGHTRFSLFHPNFEGWKASNGSYFESPEDYRDFLYSEERLKTRADVFLNHTIPTLASAPKSAIYRHVVSFSSSLPEKYKEELLTARQKYECIVLDEQETSDDALDISVYAKALVGEDGVFATFRVDDDDILASNFFTQAERFLNPAFAGMKVTFGQGCTAIYDEGRIRMLRMNYQPMIAIGLMSINRWNSDGTLTAPHVTAHNRSDRFDPVIVYSAEPSYLWLRHVGQDTNVGNKSWSESVVPLEKMLSKLDRVSPEINLSELFPTLPNAGKTLVDFGEQYEAPEPLINPRKFDLKKRISNPHLHLKGEFASDPSGSKNMLVSLHLVDTSGVRISEASQIPGLAHSVHPLVDWFVYLNEEDRVVDRVLDFSLPDGVFCDSVTIMRWHETQIVFEVSSFEISENL